MEVKKSKFLSYAQHVKTWKEAQDYLQDITMEHPKARHVCFGFVAGSNPVQERCSDDGEPTGTAGLPILGKFSPFAMY
jgi:putative IMPACT (imprinted ancient) family translation regulator